MKKITIVSLLLLCINFSNLSFAIVPLPVHSGNTFYQFKQMFESIPDYEGNPYLVTHIFTNLDRHVSKVMVFKSHDNENWQEISVINTSDLRRSSHENLSIRADLCYLHSLIQETEQHVYFKTVYELHGETYEFPVASLHIDELIEFHKVSKVTAW